MMVIINHAFIYLLLQMQSVFFVLQAESMIQNNSNNKIYIAI